MITAYRIMPNQGSQLVQCKLDTVHVKDYIKVAAVVSIVNFESLVAF